MTSGQPRILDHQCSSLSSAINCIFLQNIQFTKRVCTLADPRSHANSQYIQKNQTMLDQRPVSQN